EDGQHHATRDAGCLSAPREAGAAARAAHRRGLRYARGTRAARHRSRGRRTATRARGRDEVHRALRQNADMARGAPSRQAGLLRVSRGNIQGGYQGGTRSTAQAPRRAAPARRAVTPRETAAAAAEEAATGPSARIEPMTTPASGVITITTDFGHQGPFVGVMKGCMLARFPAARIIDLTHEIVVHWPAE